MCRGAQGDKFGSRTFVSGVLTVCLLSACAPEAVRRAQGNETGSWSTDSPVSRAASLDIPDPDKGWPEIFADYRQAMRAEIWCQPGCRLDVDPQNGTPIIPEWCTAWSELGASHFVLGGAEGELPPDSRVASYSPNQSESDVQAFVCTRIDLSRITRTSLAGADGTQRKFVLVPDVLETDRFNGDVVGMNCTPGCVLPWAAYGYNGETIEAQQERVRQGLAPNGPQALIPLPDWCAQGTNGCGGSGTEEFAQCMPERTGVAACTRMKFADMLTGEVEASPEAGQAPRTPDVP
jgi:hypothetical protein